MRRIGAMEIAVFVCLIGTALALAWVTATFFLDDAPLGEFRALSLLFAVIALLYAYGILIYRLFLHFFPLRPGEVAEGSGQEFVYHVYILFYLMLFYSIMRSGFMPAPLMRLFYLALGTRLGANTYTQGLILDPPFVEIGENSVVGQGALLVPHVIEGRRLAHYPICIGSNVTIGAHAVVLSDVQIGDRALVATGAIVTKGSRIGAGEVWGGVPARRLRGSPD